MVDAKELGLHRDVTSQSVLYPSTATMLEDSEAECQKQGWGGWIYN